jgi:hypothetical protein
MVSHSVSGSASAPIKRITGFAIVIAGWLVCLFLTSHIRQFPHFGMDYLSIYSSSRCLLDGCNPYHGDETRAAFLAHGGTQAEAEANDLAHKGVFAPYYAGYPPTSLFYFMPLAALPWQLSWHVWMVLSLTLYGLTALLFAGLCSDYSPLAANLCLACFLAMHIYGVFLLQPTYLIAALCCLGIWSLLQGRFVPAGILCYALSLALKPHLGAFALLYFLLASPVSRKRALQVVGVTILLCVPAVVWAANHDGTRHWTQDYSINVKGVASRGHLSDPGPTGNGEPSQIADLQTIVSIFRNDPAFYNPVVWGFSLVLMGAWLYPALRLAPNREKDLLCLAAIVTFSLLPIYHRVYDSTILLAAFPAIALMLKKAPRWGVVGACLSLMLALAISPNYFKYVVPVLRRLFGAASGGNAFMGLAERPLAMSLLALTVFFLVALYRIPQQLSLASGAAPEA